MYTIDFQKPIHVHFIGIGGISMSGLAEILLNRHFTVTGSDMQASDMTKHLEETGAKVVIGQKAENITDDIDLVVYTAAIHESNEEFAAAKNKGIPMMTRAALLGQIMANFACLKVNILCVKLYEKSAIRRYFEQKVYKHYI